jgi:hypothetical protein
LASVYSEKEFEEKINTFDELDWKYISWNQKLSESFIEKYPNKIAWREISQYQKLSENFIRKYINKINIHNLMDNKNISEEIKEEIKTLKEII